MASFYHLDCGPKTSVVLAALEASRRDKKALKAAKHDSLALFAPTVRSHARHPLLSYLRDHQSARSDRTMSKVLLPGDALPSSSFSSSSTVHLGPGLQSLISSLSKGKSRATSSMQVDMEANDDDSEEVFADRAGLLGMQEDKKSQKWWIEGKTRRYIPRPPEPVIGIIVARHAEGYRVDIGSSQAASLDALAFEGATKRNKPNLKVGTLVYAHLLSTPPFSEPEISCVDAATQKAAGFGELSGGFLLRHVELGRCRALLSPKHPVLTKLGKTFPFEIAVGMNGRIWIKAGEDDTEKLIDMIGQLER